MRPYRHSGGRQGAVAYSPDDIFPPYCGIELLPHAVAPDGTPAPVLCDQEVHGKESMHLSDEPEVYWDWQDESVSDD